MLNFLFTHTPLFYLTQSVWRDEAFSVLLAKQDFFSILTLSAKDFSPPLYILLLKIWISLFGTSEIAIRSLSFIIFLVGIYYFFLFLYDVFKIQTNFAYIYVLLVLTNPFLNYYAFEARGYSLLATLSL